MLRIRILRVSLLHLEPMRGPSIFIVNPLAIIFACAISESTDGETLTEAVAAAIHESDRQRLFELAERGVTLLPVNS